MSYAVTNAGIQCNRLPVDNADPMKHGWPMNVTFCLENQWKNLKADRTWGVDWTADGEYQVGKATPAYWSDKDSVRGEFKKFMPAVATHFRRDGVWMVKVITAAFRGE